MRQFLFGAVAALFAFANSAEAQQYGQSYHPQQQQQRRGHDDNDVRDAALAGVVVGVIVDRALTGGNRQQYRRQPYSRGYGQQPMYVQPRGGYYQPPPRYVLGQRHERRGGYVYLCTDYSDGYHHCTPC